MKITGKKILIVEDEVLLSMDLEMLLKEMGHMVLGSALTGKEALAFMEDNIPDMVLIDIKLNGDMDGIETSKMIMRDYNVPVIFMTGNTDRHTLTKANNLNPVGILRKPISDNELSAVLQGFSVNGQ